MGTGVSSEKNQEFLQNFDFGGYSIRKTANFEAHIPDSNPGSGATYRIFKNCEKGRATKLNFYLHP